MVNISFLFVCPFSFLKVCNFLFSAVPLDERVDYFKKFEIPMLL